MLGRGSTRKIIKVCSALKGADHTAFPGNPSIMGGGRYPGRVLINH